jgi:hypothetical protein
MKGSEMADRVQELVQEVLKRHLSNITTLVVMEWCRRVLRDRACVEGDEVPAFLGAVRCSAGFFLNERAVDDLWRDLEGLRLEERDSRPTRSLRFAWRSGNQK